MKQAMAAGAAALTLLDISAATPAAAQNAAAFQGYYAGAHTGHYSAEATFTSAPYTFRNTFFTGIAPARSDAFDFEGFLAGVHSGYNIALGPNVIVGVESDWSALGDDDSVSMPRRVVGADGLSFQYRSELELEWQATLRGRIGFVAGNALFFATAGLALLHVDWTETASHTCFGCPTVTFNHAKSETLVGGVVGAGAELALTPTIIVGTDYLYENFGSLDSVPHGVGAGLTGKIDDIDVHKVRVRVSVKLGGPPL